MTSSAAARLRTLIAGPDVVLAPGAPDALTARLVEAAGFPAVYLTGRVPVIADADTGYGGPSNIERAVREHVRAGVAAIHLVFVDGLRLLGDLEATAAAVEAPKLPDTLEHLRTEGGPARVDYAEFTDVVGLAHHQDLDRTYGE